MSIWDIYAQRANSRGSTQRETVLKNTIRTLGKKLLHSLSYHTVKVDDLFYEVAIINSDNINEKKIISKPSDNLNSGNVISWRDNHWLVVESDANTEVYTSGKIIRCNHLLKWIDSDGVIHEQWCVIEDGTKYLTGEYEDREFVVTRGDSRIAMTISKNEHTAKFGREHRFLIDDPDSTDKLSYLLTKPLKVGMVYSGEGVYSFVLQEVVSTDDDNHELGIADYYKYFPTPSNNDLVDANNKNPNGKKVWL